MTTGALKDFKKWVEDNPVVGVDIEHYSGGAYLKLIKIKDEKLTDEVFVIQIRSSTKNQSLKH